MAELVSLSYEIIDGYKLNDIAKDPNFTKYTTNYIREYWST